jgi:hypothetical protein
LKAEQQNRGAFEAVLSSGVGVVNLIPQADASKSRNLGKLKTPKIDCGHRPLSRSEGTEDEVSACKKKQCPAWQK